MDINLVTNPIERFNDFKKHCQKVVEKVKKENKLVHIVGNFNCDFLRNEKQPRAYKIGRTILV